VTSQTKKEPEEEMETESFGLEALFFESDEEDPTEGSMCTLLEKGIPTLNTLILKQMSGGGADYLDALVPSRFPRLVKIALSGFTGISGRPLRKLFKNFPNLRSFGLTDSEELTDEDLCPEEETDAGDDEELDMSGVEWSLGNLKNLRFLNLSRTPIGNPTLTDCVALMRNLKCLRLDGTDIDKSDLEAIFTAASDTSQYPNFQCVTCTGCPHCRLVPEEIGELRKIASHVDVACTVDISNLT